MSDFQENDGFPILGLKKKNSLQPEHLPALSQDRKEGPEYRAWGMEEMEWPWHYH